MLTTLPLLFALSTPAQADPVDVGGLTLDVARVQDVKIGTSGFEVVVVLELTRTSWPSFVLSGLDFDLVVSGDKVGKATMDDSVKLKNGVPTEVAIQCEMSELGGIAAVLGGLSRGDVSFKLQGEAAGRIFIFPKTYTYESETIRL